MSAGSFITPKVLAWAFLLTGIFAIVGALYTWGAGPIYEQSDLSISLIPIADLILAGPFSLLSAFALFRQKHWAKWVGSLTSGMYLFGTIEVLTAFCWKGSHYDWWLLIPPIFGVGIVVAFMLWCLNPEQ